MIQLTDILQMLGIVALMIFAVFVIRARHKGKAEHDLTYSRENVCEHLRPAFDKLIEQGHRISRVGQKGPDMPLEVHFEPGFSPQELYDQLKLEPPAQVSERNVLFCKECWCELHPPK